MSSLFLTTKTFFYPFFVLLCLIKAADFMYLFQIKEYRMDRFLSYLKEEGIIKTFYLRAPRIPAKSIRNVLILILSLFLIFIIPIEMFSNSAEYLILIIVIPVISFFFVSLAVWLTGFLAAIQRNNYIDKAADKLRHYHVITIGITGSYGKSSVKEFLYQILSAHFKTAKTDENMNTDVGVAICILKNLKPDTQYFIAEMGAYRIGEIAKICRLVHPHFAIVTAVGNQHLDLFGSRENIAHAKSELVAALPKSGKAYLNNTIAYKSVFEGKAHCPIVYYSPQNSELHFQIQEETIQGITATIFYGNQSFTIHTKLLGTHNLENLLPAIGLGIDLGVPIEKIQETTQGMENIEGKLSVHTGLNGATILNDAKNSSVEGFIAALKTASTFSYEKKYIISKGIIELGTEKGESYKRIINVLNDVGLILLTTDSLFKTISTHNNVQLYKNEEEMLDYMKHTFNNKTLAVLEGRFTKNFTTQTIL